MRNSLLLVLVLAISACQSTKIKNDTYKVSSTPVELGSIGEATSLLGRQNGFKTRTLPKLEKEIRVSLAITPFNKKLAKFYNSRFESNQGQMPINYADSLAAKPELALVTILDILGFTNELNAVHNTDVFALLQSNSKLHLVSSIAIVLSQDDLARIRQADAYYLFNVQERKYAISLYKQGKKTGTLELDAKAVIGHTLSKFCWTMANGKWHVADIVHDSKRCTGSTKSRPLRKKAQNIYKL